MFWPAPEGLEEEDAVRDPADSEACEGRGLGSSFVASCFGAALGAALDSSGGISRELMSSPASARTAILDPTCTPFVPSTWMIFAIIPSSWASTSIVALSVSISSRTSPVENESPSFTFQLAMFPSVIVGDIAGMVKFCASSKYEAVANFLLCDNW